MGTTAHENGHSIPTRSTALQAAKVRHRLEKVTHLVQESASGFKPRGFLLPVLQRLCELAADGALKSLCSDRWRSPSGASLLQALGDAVDSCWVVLASLEDETLKPSWAVNGKMPYFPLVTLRRQTQRLEALRTALQFAVKGCEVPLSEWDPSTVLVSGSLECFWRRHFPCQFAVPTTQFLEGFARNYECLSEAEGEELVAWLRVEGQDHISVADASALMDGIGPWRSALLYTSWLELCPESLLHAIMAGGQDRHVAMTAADIAVEKRKKRCSVLLPGWSRAQLRTERSALVLLRALGLHVVADIRGGLLVEFRFLGPSEQLMNKQSALAATCREVLGGVGFAAVPVGIESIARCVAASASKAYRIDEARNRHVTLSRIRRRKTLELHDDAEDLLCLQKQHQTLIKGHFHQGGSDMVAIQSNALSSSLADGCENRLTVREMLQENRVARRASQQCQLMRIEVEMLRIADMTFSEEVMPQLERLAVEESFVSHEAVLLMEINLYMERQTATRAAMSQMENTLVDLEASFARLRCQMMLRDDELSGRIEEAEAELVAASGSLAGRREASREVTDTILDACQELAEHMMPLPLGSREDAVAAAEARLEQQIELLKRRTEDLDKRYKRAKAAAKKR